MTKAKKPTNRSTRQGILFNMFRNKKYLEQYDWIDSLSECGGYSTVGVGMIAKLQEVIRETYKAGFKDGEKSSQKRKVQTPRSIRDCGILRLRKKKHIPSP